MKSWQEREIIMKKLVRKYKKGLSELASKIKTLIENAWPGAYVENVEIHAKNCAPVLINIKTSTIMGCKLHKLWIYNGFERGIIIEGIVGDLVEYDFYNCPTTFKSLEESDLPNIEELKRLIEEILEYSINANKHIVDETYCQPGLKVSTN